jgi:hypothetical protein
MPRTGVTSKGWYAGQFARWLAGVAALLQAMLPLLVAVEMGLVDPATGAMPCAVGEAHHVPAAMAHHHGEHHQDGTGQKAPAPSHHGPCCAICVALHAAHAFTAPGEIALPLPRAGDRIAVATGSRILAAGALPASYNPRAPPSLA